MEIIENAQEQTFEISQELLEMLGESEPRNVHFNNDVDDEFLNMVLCKLVKWETEDLGMPIEQRVPVNFYLNSLGGDITTGLAIIDFIQQMQTPVNMIVTKAYSMATAILLSVPLENRYMFKNASILIHEGSMELSGGMRKVSTTIDFMKRIATVYDNMIIHNTNITKKKLHKRKGDEWYIFSEEAKRLGLVGSIIGQDCLLQDIL